jgi:hypothetical protein
MRVNIEVLTGIIVIDKGVNEEIVAFLKGCFNLLIMILLKYGIQMF